MKYPFGIKQQLAVLLCLCGIMGLSASKAFAVEITIVRNDGTVVAGELDAKTDAERLWWSANVPGIQLKSSARWSNVQSVFIEGKQTAAKKIIASANKLRSLEKGEMKVERAIAQHQFWFAKRPDQFEEPLNKSFGNREHLPVLRNYSSKVASFQMEAHLANWDRDAQLDGLIVHIVPLDARGNVVPTDGQIEMQLTGQRYYRREAMHRNQRRQFYQLESWTQQIRKSDFDASGAIVKLEFRKIRPEQEPNLARTALLTGSLGIAGQGKFEAYATDVFVRPHSYFRDQLRLRSNTNARSRPTFW